MRGGAKDVSPEIASAMRALLESAPQAQDDPNRPVYHFLAPSQWMNDISIVGACGEAGTPIYEAENEDIKRWIYRGIMWDKSVGRPNCIPLGDRFWAGR